MANPYLETRVVIRDRDGTRPDQPLAAFETGPADWDLIMRALRSYGRPGGEIRAKAMRLRAKIETEILGKLHEERGA